MCFLLTFFLEATVVGQKYKKKGVHIIPVAVRYHSASVSLSPPNHTCFSSITVSENGNVTAL